MLWCVLNCPWVLVRKWNELLLNFGGEDRRRLKDWVAWDKMTVSKKLGGLGFRDLMGFNLAMLAKISWRVLHNPKSVLGVVLKDKYFPNSSFLVANKQNKSSWGWKGILLGREVLNCGLRWWVGNGESIRIASDPWIPKPHSFKPRLWNEAPNLKVCELITDDRKRWKMDKVATLVAPEDLEEIFQLVEVGARIKGYGIT